jgi:hypothetical protein
MSYKPIKGDYALYEVKWPKRSKMAGKWRKKLKWLGCDLSEIVERGKKPLKQGVWGRNRGRRGPVGGKIA